jgi:heterogeneous nuclear ribonucleoprotein R
MSDWQQSEEPEEQLDLKGDDDVMDDDAGYRRRCRDESEEPLEDDENDDRQTEDDGRGEDDAGMAIEGEEPAAGDGGGETDKKGAQGPEDEEERKKWDELLALPPHGSEVLIGRLPRDITEEDLHELCEPFGEINEVCCSAQLFFRINWPRCNVESDV